MDALFADLCRHATKVISFLFDFTLDCSDVRLGDIPRTVADADGRAWGWNQDEVDDLSAHSRRLDRSIFG